MAHDYPKCQVIGIDVILPLEEEPIPSAGQTNVRFQYGDILQKRLLFVDEYFDFVYQRDVATVLPFESWPNLIQEFYRVLKSGGQIQLVEYGNSVVIH